MISDFKKQQSIFFTCAAFSGLITVSFGAFGAHILSKHLSSEMLEIFRTGIQYQMFHTLILMIMSVLDERFYRKWITAAGWFFLSGICIFSGSLYALAITGIRVWGAITPLGGLCFMIGWLILFFGSQTGNQHS